MIRRFLPAAVLLLVSASLLSCAPGSYGYEVINDSGDTLTEVRVMDPNFSFPGQDLQPYQSGGVVILDGARLPRQVEVRWRRSGRSLKSVRIRTGFDCPDTFFRRPNTLQYWLRADDTVRTRFLWSAPEPSSVFVPCESDAERATRIANDELENAARSGDLRRTEMALFRARLNPESYFDPAPLHIAAGAGHTRLVERLLQRGARIEVPQRIYSRSALLVAIQAGHLDVAELLVSSGAALDDVSSNESPLLAASRLGYLDLVRLLLDRGADVHLKALGQSALINAAREGHRDIVALLLERGADPNTTLGGISTTALDIAYDNRRGDVVALLESCGARRGPPR